MYERLKEPSHAHPDPANRKPSVGEASPQRPAPYGASPRRREFRPDAKGFGRSALTVSAAWVNRFTAGYDLPSRTTPSITKGAQTKTCGPTLPIGASRLRKLGTSAREHEKTHLRMLRIDVYFRLGRDCAKALRDRRRPVWIVGDDWRAQGTQ
jgi:hypothetical protein